MKYKSGYVFIKNKYILIASIIYIYIPLFLFLFGWTKIIYAIISACVILWSSKKIISDLDIINEEILIDVSVIFFTVIIFCLVAYFAGWGRFNTQPNDWRKHNAILYDLVNKPWPVYYHVGNEHSYLSYYIGLYLLPALLGKLFDSIRVAEIGLCFWGIIGLMLVWLYILSYLKSGKGVIPIIVSLFMSFFSPPLIIAQKLSDFVYWNEPIVANELEWFSRYNLQYSNNYTLLRWVYPQVIVSWLVAIIFMINIDKIENYVFIIMPTLLFGTFSFVALVFFAIGYAIYKLIKSFRQNGNDSLQSVTKRIFSISNISSFLSFGMILILYFSGNIISDKPVEISFSFNNYDGHILKYFIFVTINVGLIGASLLVDNYCNYIFYAALVELVVLPIFKLGLWNDLVMRASIPAFFVLMVLTVQFLKKVMEKGYDKLKMLSKISFLGIVFLIMFGLTHEMQAFTNDIVDADFRKLGNNTDWNSMEINATRSGGNSVDYLYNYYVYDCKNNIFYNYIARKKG